MNINIGLRPGVYSAFETSSVRYERRGGTVGIVGCSSTATKNTLYTFHSAAEARATLGPDVSGINGPRMAELAFLNGASTVHFAVVSTNSTIITNDATTCLKLLENVDVDAVVIEIAIETLNTELRSHLATCNANRRERIGVICMQNTGYKAYNYEDESLVLLVPPKAANLSTYVSAAGNKYQEPLISAAFAGLLVSTADPSVPMTGATLQGLSYNAELLDNATVDQLIGWGNSPIEFPGGVPTVVRAVTTRTKTNGVADATWREVTTVRIISHVMKTLRATLAARFSRAKNLADTREAVRTQTVVELENLKNSGIIADYGNVLAEQNADDPTRCDISFEFAVAHGMNTIVINASVII